MTIQQTLFSCFQLLLHYVQVVDVGGVVLRVVYPHNFLTHVRLQSTVRVGQVREGVLLPERTGETGSHQESGIQ